MEMMNEAPGGKSAAQTGRVLEEARVELAIRVALMFFFIQFVVVMAMMSVAMLRARSEVPAGRMPSGSRTLHRPVALAANLPGGGLRSILRKAKSIRLRDVY
jgi:hypothetical protein